MAIFNKINQFVADAANKVHNLGADTLMVALTNAANPPLATNTLLANLTQISYTNMSSRALTTTSSTQTAGLYKLILADLVITQSTTSSAAFRYITLYNSTAVGSPLIGFWDYGSDLVLAPSESITLDLDQVNGTLTLQ